MAALHDCTDQRNCADAQPRSGHAYVPLHAAPGPVRRRLSLPGLILAVTLVAAILLGLLGLAVHLADVLSSRQPSTSAGGLASGSAGSISGTDGAGSITTTGDSADNLSTAASDATAETTVPSWDAQITARVQAAIQEQIQAGLAGATAATVSACVLPLADPTQLTGVNIDLAMPPASTIKLLILITLIDQAAAGVRDMQTVLTLEASDIVDGSGTLQFEEPGSTYTLAELAWYMIAQSDNVAANILIDYLGFDAINQEASNLGLSGTYLANKFNSTETHDPTTGSYTTTRDLARMLQHIATGQVADESLCSFALQCMVEQQIDGALAPAVPDGVTVAYKTGSYPGVRNECALIYAGMPYAVAIMTEDMDDTAALTLIGNISRAVYWAQQ